MSLRSENRLHSILKGRQIEERIVLRRLADVNEVVDRRRSIFSQAQALRSSLLDRVNQFRGSKRHRAVAAGRIARVRSIETYVEKMDQDLRRLEKDERQRAEELKTAEDRASVIEQELIEIRLEMKKIERFIENLSRRRRALGVAREELMLDEMISSLTKRGS